MEYWEPVLGYEDLYLVSDHGNIWSIKHSLVKKTFINCNGRPFTNLSKSGVNRPYTIHKLVIEAFVGPMPQPKMHCCHNDGNPLNNHLTNLRWDTCKNNHADRVRHGTLPWGEKSSVAKLTAIQIEAIKADTRPQRFIATDYGIAQGHVSRIKNGVRRAHG